MKTSLAKITSFFYSALLVAVLLLVAGFDAIPSAAAAFAISYGLQFVKMDLRGTLASSPTFTCAQLQAIMGRTDIYWADNMAVKEQMTPQVAALQAIRENQTARLEVLQGRKKNVLNLFWPQACFQSKDCGDGCSPGGDRLSADCKEYEPNLCREAGFNVGENDYDETYFSREELVAIGIMRASKVLDEWLAQQAVAHLHAFRGVSTYVPSYGSQSNNIITIPAAYWTPEMFAELTAIGIKNYMSSAFLLSGMNLFTQAATINAKSDNADGKGDANLFNSIRKYFDLFNIDSTLGTPSTFLIERSAVAFAHKNKYEANPIRIEGEQTQIRWSVESRGLPGVRYDVHYTQACEAGGEIVDKFSLYAKGLFALNPAGCNENITGVLELRCAA